MREQDGNSDIVGTKQVLNVRDPAVDTLKILTSFQSTREKLALERDNRVAELEFKQLKAANETLQALVSMFLKDAQTQGKLGDSVLLELGSLRHQVADLTGQLAKAKKKKKAMAEDRDSTEAMVLSAVVGIGKAFEGPRVLGQVEMAEALRAVPGCTKPRALEYLSGIMEIVERWP